MAIPKFFRNSNGKIQESDIGIDQSVGASDGHKVIVTDLATGKMHKSFKPGNNGFDYVGNWQGKPTLLTNAYTDRIFITDVGVGGSEWYWDGARWRAVGGQVILRNALSGTQITANGTQTLVTNALIIGGVVQDGDRLDIELTAGKTGTTLALTSSVYMGTTGTTSDTTVISSSISGTSTLNFSILNRLNRINNTTLRRVQGTAAAPFAADGSSNPEYTVSSMNSDFYISYQGQIASGSGNTLDLKMFQITLKTCG